jgi:hypothetical protein
MTPGKAVHFESPIIEQRIVLFCARPQMLSGDMSIRVKFVLEGTVVLGMTNGEFIMAQLNVSRVASEVITQE